MKNWPVGNKVLYFSKHLLSVCVCKCTCAHIHTKTLCETEMQDVAPAFKMGRNLTGEDLDASWKDLTIYMSVAERSKWRLDVKACGNSVHDQRDPSSLEAFWELGH